MRQWPRPCSSGRDHPVNSVTSLESKTIARKPITDGTESSKSRRTSPRTVTAPNMAVSPGSPRKKAAAAGPRAAAAKASEAKDQAVAARERLDAIQAVIIESLEDDKAEDILTLDLAGRAAFTDRMIIATGLADRQISAMAMHLQQKLRDAGVGRVPVEGAGGSDWVLIDAGDIVVHLFKPEARALYRLEKMWSAELDDAESDA
ncbi:iojap protein family [Granulibacter bethesdensis CGDNIH4]|nr:iojap protein family [Granulibacter bethesdensis CGDNIH4]